MVYCTGLENRSLGNGAASSNLAFSAVLNAVKNCVEEEVWRHFRARFEALLSILMS